MSNWLLVTTDPMVLWGNMQVNTHTHSRAHSHAVQVNMHRLVLLLLPQLINAVHLNTYRGYS